MRRKILILLAVFASFMWAGIVCAEPKQKYEHSLKEPFENAPLDTILFSEVSRASFSPDNRFLATGYDNTVRIFEVGSWREITQMKHRDTVYSVSFSPDGRFLATGSDNNIARIFEVGSWREIAQMEHPKWVNSLSFSPDGRFLATGSFDNGWNSTAHIFEVGGWSEITQLKHRYGIYSVSFSPDGRFLATGYGDNTARIFEVGSWKEIAQMKHSDNVNSVSFSPDGRFLATGSNDNTARIFEVGSWKEIFQMKHRRGVDSVSFSPDGNFLAARSDDISIIYDVNDWGEVVSIRDFSLKAMNRDFLIGIKNKALVSLDMSGFSQRALENDLFKLGFQEQLGSLTRRSKEIEADFNGKLKIIQNERNESLTRYKNTEKDEFETDIEYKARMVDMQTKQKEIEDAFNEKRQSLRRERAGKRVQLVDFYEKELNKQLISTRKPVKGLVPVLGKYSPEAGIFPVSVDQAEVKPFNGVVKVPRANARNFKDSVPKLQVSGEIQLDRMGHKRLMNIVINNPETGETYYLAKASTIQGEQVAALPPSLSASIKLLEPSGDDALNAEETARLVVKIKNDGQGSAYNVTARPVPSEAIKDLNYDPERTIPEISPGAEQEIVFPLKAGIDLPERLAQFKVEFEEKNGLPPNPVKISFQTRAVLKPDLQVIDYVIDDATKDGMIQQEEVVKMTFRVQNKGQGTGRSVAARVTLGPNVFPALNIPLEHSLGEMKPNGMKEFTAAFYTNQKITERLPLKVDINEARGRFDAEKQYALKMNIKEKTVFETVVSAKEQKLVGITDMESPSDLEQDIPATGLVNKNAVAVVIGNYDYKNVQKVAYARRDAVTMKEYLVKAFGYDPGNIIFLPDATLADMVDAFGGKGEARKSKISHFMRKDSEVFVYYTGHGAPGLQDKKGYLVPIDANPNNIETTGYSLETLYRNLELLKAAKVTVVIDACFSGDSQAGILFKNASPIMLEAKIDRLHGGTVITSSASDQISSWYPEKKHSLFTYFFLKGIKDSASSGKTVVLNDLKSYVSDEVDRIAKRLYGRTQTPGFEGNLEEKLIEVK